MRSGIEIYKKFRKGVTNYKTTNQAYFNHTSHGRKLKGGEAASLTNPKKGLDGTQMKNYAGHPSDNPTCDKIFFLHVTGLSTEECKLLREYSENTPPISHKKIMCKQKVQARKNCKFKSSAQDMQNIIKKAIFAILKNKWKKQSKKCNLVPENSAPEEDGFTYGIDRLNIDVAESDFGK